MKQRRTSLKDLADKLGVSIATVSRALRNSHEVGEEMTQKVKTLAKELNTTVDAIRKRINRGLIPAHKNGRMWFILKSEYVRSLREK